MRYTTATGVDIFDNWFDPIETDLRTRVSGFIETMIEAELATALGRRALWVAAWIDSRKMASPVN